jgi:hypothetical protein
MHCMAYFIEALMAAGDRRYDCVILSIRQAERRIGAADSRASGAGCGIQIALFCLPPTVPMRSTLALAATLGDTTSRAEHATLAVVAGSYGRAGSVGGLAGGVERAWSKTSPV